MKVDGSIDSGVGGDFFDFIDLTKLEGNRCSGSLDFFDVDDRLKRLRTRLETL